MEKQLEQEWAEYWGSLVRARRRTLGYRNGHYVRHLLTELGDLELLVPRVAKEDCPPSSLNAMAGAVAPSMRRFLDCFCLGPVHPQGGWGLSAVARGEGFSRHHFALAEELDELVSLYHSRLLKDHYAYLFFDRVVLKNKRAAKVQKKILLCVFGITVEGQQEMMDFYPAASESAACWESFLYDLYKRGLKEVFAS